MSYNVVDRNKELQQRICNIICYVYWLYERKIINERTKNELLKLCNPIDERNVQYEKRHK
jgi:hypothetical protein